MIRSIITLCILTLFSSAAIAQTSYLELFDVATADNSSQLSDKVEDHLSLSLNNQTFEKVFTEKPGSMKIRIPINSVTKATLLLNKFEILTPDAKLVEMKNGNETELDINNINISYTGTVEGLENSFVTINFSVNGVNGIVISSNDRYVLGKASSSNNYMIFQESKLKIHSDLICGSTDMDVPETVKQMMKTSERVSATTDLLNANIAIDVDLATYNMFGSVQNATGYVLGLMTSVSALYVREMNIKLSVPYVRVWSTADPYTGTTSGNILTQFRNTWNSSQQGVPRTVAHLISTRGGGLGGVAYLDVLCASTSNGFGYGFSNTNGVYNLIPTYSWDVNVVAHELGHNFGSPHTHDCSWPGGPIDSCYQVNGGCYSGPVISRKGTIMSYCHLTSAGINLDFGTLPRNLIRTSAEGAGCITTVAAQTF